MCIDLKRNRFISFILFSNHKLNYKSRKIIKRIYLFLLELIGIKCLNVYLILKQLILILFKNLKNICWKINNLLIGINSYFLQKLLIRKESEIDWHLWLKFLIPCTNKYLLKSRLSLYAPLINTLNFQPKNGRDKRSWDSDLT